MKTIDRIITVVDTRYGAPMGRPNTGSLKFDGSRLYDCYVPMSPDGVYDRGGAYWGTGPRLRVKYKKDLSYVRFYRQ